MAEVAELEKCNLVGSPISSGEDDDEAPESVSFNQGREEALQSKARALHELQRFVGTCYITSRNNNPPFQTDAPESRRTKFSIKFMKSLISEKIRSDWHTNSPKIDCCIHSERLEWLLI